jgi:chemotaxis signal transduction protein
MLREYPSDMPWAVVQLKNQCFALATQDVREMLMIPDTAQVPNMPDYVRGVINLRGRVMPLVDLRKRLGMVSASEEIDGFCSLMTQREQDHRKWLAELEASAQEHREFKLTTDPHKCAFGKWYDTYQAENPWVAALLKKFDEPHKKIHGVGLQVVQFVADGRLDQALQLLAKTRCQELSSMIRLFESLRDLVRVEQRETAVIFTVLGHTFAGSVDSAVSIEKLTPGSVAPLPAGAGASHNSLVQRTGRRAKDNQLLMILEADRILERELVEKFAA